MNVILKSKFRVKDNTKELCFSDYFYGCFSQKNVRVGGRKEKEKRKKKKRKEKKRTVDGNEYRPS